MDQTQLKKIRSRTSYKQMMNTLKWLETSPSLTELLAKIHESETTGHNMYNKYSKESLLQITKDYNNVK